MSNHNANANISTHTQNIVNLNKSLIIEQRAKAHHLKPCVMIGHNGLTEGVLKEIDINLAAHNLIKIRILTDNKETIQQARQIITQQLNSILIQSIGKLLILYRKGEAVLQHEKPEYNILNRKTSM